MSQRRPDDLPEIPELAGEYELVRELGRGGTAVVYLARDRELGRDVAIKLIRQSYVQDEDAVARLVREARTVGKLQHPNIVMLLGTRRLADGGLALILQYVPGRSLKDRIREEGPLPFDEAERILRDLGRALSYAHRSRIVHRDLKPENVYLDEALGIARLADFGIARAWDSDSGLTLPGTAIGTPAYMSPEQVDGRDLDGRSDIYSLGLLGWEMLSGKQPWAGESLYSVIGKQKNEHLPDLETLRPGIPKNLRRALEGAMKKAPEDRWRSADTFLEVLAEGSTLEADPPSDRSLTPARGGAVPFPVPSWSPDAPDVSAPPGGARPSGEPPVPPPGAGIPGGRRAPGPDPRAALPPHSPPAGATEGEPSRWVVRVGALVALLLLVIGGFWFAGPEGEAGAFVDRMNPLSGSDGEIFDDSPWLREDLDPESTPIDTDAPLPTVADGEEGTLLDTLGLEGVEDAGELLGEESLLLILQGDGQAGAPGRELPTPLVLQLIDAEGAGIPGTTLEFEVVSGGGAVDPPVDVTRPDGSSLVRWTLGDEGDQQLVARLEGDEVEVQFQAFLTEAVPTGLEAVQEEPVTGRVGEVVEAPVEVRVLDAGGDVLEGVSVRFQPEEGAGAVDPETAVTDSDGIARTRWTLGSSVGRQSLTAQVVGEPGLLTTLDADAVPASLPVRAGTVVGGSHSCTLGSGGTLRCWGGNAHGQLGDGTRNRATTPAAPVVGSPFARVSSGVSHLCALSPAGEAWCWGSNDRGQSGGGAGSDLLEPRRVGGEVTFTEITAGLGHSCGLTATGQAWCWGANPAGQLGDGTTTARSEPVPVAGDFRFSSIVAGWDHTCALDDQGKAYCWGTGGAGRLGTGSNASASTPQRVIGGLGFVALAAGNAHSCGLSTDGRIHCWGANEDGRLGTGEFGSSRSTPALVALDETFVALAAGGVHNCAIAEGGRAFCWGRNLHGQLGDGTTEDRNTPTPVEGGYTFQSIVAVGSHTCGRVSGGEMRCWGYNVDGQLGDGSRQNRSSPVAVPGN